MTALAPMPALLPLRRCWRAARTWCAGSPPAHACLRGAAAPPPPLQHARPSVHERAAASGRRASRVPCAVGACAHAQRRRLCARAAACAAAACA
jgi:hypothetical protein